MSEIRLWEAYFADAVERHEKVEWYLAQVAKAIDDRMSSKPRKRPLKSYLLKFKRPKPKTPMDEERAKQMTIAWVQGLAGLAAVQNASNKPPRQPKGKQK